MDLKGWNEGTADGKMVVAGKKDLNDVFRARLYICRSGSSCEQYRRDCINERTSRSREQPRDVGEANWLMECHKPMMTNRRRPEEPCS